MVYRMTSKGQFQVWASGQGQVRSWPNRRRSCCISIDGHEPGGHFGAYPMSLSLFGRELSLKNESNPWVTSDDLVEVTDQKLYLGPHKWPKKTWSWKNWRERMCTGEERSISIFPHWLIMGKSQNWPDLRSSRSKSRSIQNVSIIPLMNVCESQVDRIKTRALARPQTFFEVWSLDLTLWPDLRWPWVKIFRKGAELMT